MFWLHILSSPDRVIYLAPLDVDYSEHSFPGLYKSILKNESTWK